MADLKSQAVSRSAIYNMDPKDLVLRGDWNARIMDDPDSLVALKELEDSIESEGVREPITVIQEDGRVVVTNGFRRTTAVHNLLARGVEIPTVPCIIEPRGSNEADHVLSQITRNSGRPLTPFEQGRVYKRLIAFGWAVAEIAKRTGKSVAHINQALQLQEAPAEVQRLVVVGDVSATLAAKVIRQSGAKEGAAKLAKAVSTAKAAGKTHATEKHVSKSPKPAPAVASPAVWDAPGSPTPTTKMVDALRKIVALDATTTVDIAQSIAREALRAVGESL